jgi:hypothetical protein
MKVCLDFRMAAFPIETYHLYVEFLENRIRSQQYITEDSVRYAFFNAALQTTEIKQHEIILELPHPKFTGKEIDTYVQAEGNRPEIFCEFKFHRVSNSTSPTTQKAGSLFKDISRLSAIKSENCSCFVIYLTDAEMAKYFEKNSENHSHFWDLPMGSDFIYDDGFVAKTANTFQKSSDELHRARVKIEFSAQLSKDYHLRVFEIKEI